MDLWHSNSLNPEPFWLYSSFLSGSYLGFPNFLHEVSAAIFIPNKRRDNHEEFFQLWVAVCGSPQKVLVENEGEFAIDDFSKNNRSPWNQCFNYSCRILVKQRCCWKAQPGTCYNDWQDNRRHQTFFALSMKSTWGIIQKNLYAIRGWLRQNWQQYTMFVCFKLIKVIKKDSSKHK